jgi:hypothetical protein
MTTIRTVLAALILTLLTSLATGCGKVKTLGHCWSNDRRLCDEFFGPNKRGYRISASLYCWGRKFKSGECDQDGSTGSCQTGSIKNDNGDTIIVTTYYYMQDPPKCTWDNPD